MDSSSVRPKPPPSPPTLPEPHPPYLVHIGKSGKDALWAGFVVFVLATLLISVLAVRLHVKHRALHYITLIVTGVAALANYAMATGGGYKYVFIGTRIIQGVEVRVLRQVFWARFAGWAISSPLILFDLALLAGLPWADVVLLLVADEVAVFCATFTALSSGRPASRWGWYAFACIFLILVFLSILLKGRKYCKNQHDSVSRLFTYLALYSVTVWILYPVFFALGPVTGIIGPDAETIAFTVLDVLSQAVFGILLIFVHKHDNEEHSARFTDAWFEPRGTRGAIHLPGGED